MFRIFVWHPMMLHVLVSATNMYQQHSTCLSLAQSSKNVAGRASHVEDQSLSFFTYIYIHYENKTKKSLISCAFCFLAK